MQPEIAQPAARVHHFHVLATEQILGVHFWNGDAAGAVDAMCRNGGLLVVPAAPALVNICYDEEYRRALLEADVAIADSGFMVLLWKLLKRRSVRRVSGLVYLNQLLTQPGLREQGALFALLPNENARAKAIAWLTSQGFLIARDGCYLAPDYTRQETGGQRSDINDETLLHLIETNRPAHIIIGIGGGNQERLGLYLRDNLPYRPAIHCIGAALGFLTGDQRPIPLWADGLYLGWILRLSRNPRRYFRRFWIAHELPGLIARYGSQLPPLKSGR